MNEKLLLMKSFLIGGAALLATSCTNEEIIGGNPDSESGNPGLTISIKTPAADGVVFTKAGTIEDEAAEWAVKTLNVYLFNKSAETGQDSDYKLFKHTQLDLSSDGVTSSGNGTYSYNEPITADMIGKTMKVVLVANDAPEGVSANTDGASGTGLDVFKTKLANAEVSEGSPADVLVGNGTSGFPMSYVGESDITITPMGHSIDATLTRIVARLDIFNFTPNLIVKDVKLINASSSSYLFPTGTEPSTNYYTINNCSEYDDVFSTGVSFKDPGQTPITEDNSKADNTLDHVLYMYEQSNGDGTKASIVVSYQIEQTGGVKIDGEVSVKLTTAIKQNTLYTVKLGNGSPVQDKVPASLDVEDWINQNIESDLAPDGNNQVEE